MWSAPDDTEGDQALSFSQLLSQNTQIDEAYQLSLRRSQPETNLLSPFQPRPRFLSEENNVPLSQTAFGVGAGVAYVTEAAAATQEIKRVKPTLASPRGIQSITADADENVEENAGTLGAFSQPLPPLSSTQSALTKPAMVMHGQETQSQTPLPPTTTDSLEIVAPPTRRLDEGIQTGVTANVTSGLVTTSSSTRPGSFAKPAGSMPQKELSPRPPPTRSSSKAVGSKRSVARGKSSEPVRMFNSLIRSPVGERPPASSPAAAVTGAAHSQPPLLESPSADVDARQVQVPLLNATQTAPINPVLTAIQSSIKSRQIFDPSIKVSDLRKEASLGLNECTSPRSVLPQQACPIPGIKDAVNGKSYAMLYGELLTLYYYKRNFLSVNDLISTYTVEDLRRIAVTNNFIAEFHGGDTAQAYALYILQKLANGSLAIPVLHPLNLPATSPTASSSPVEEKLNSAPKVMRVPAWGPFAPAVLLGGSPTTPLKFDVEAYLRFAAEQMVGVSDRCDAFTQAFKSPIGSGISSTCEALSQLLEIFRKRMSTAKRGQQTDKLLLDVEVVSVTCIVCGLKGERTETLTLLTTLGKSGRSLSGQGRPASKTPEESKSDAAVPQYYDMKYVGLTDSTQLLIARLEAILPQVDHGIFESSHADVVRVRAFKPKGEASLQPGGSKDLILLLPSAAVHPLDTVWSNAGRPLRSMRMPTPVPGLPTIRAFKHILYRMSETGPHHADLKVGDIGLVTLHSPAGFASLEAMLQQLDPEVRAAIDASQSDSHANSNELVFGQSFKRLFYSEAKISHKLRTAKGDDWDDPLTKEMRQYGGLPVLVCEIKESSSSSKPRMISGVWLSPKPWERISLGSREIRTRLSTDGYLSGVTVSSLPADLLLKPGPALTSRLDAELRSLSESLHFTQSLSEISCTKSKDCIQTLITLRILLPEPEYLIYHDFDQVLLETQNLGINKALLDLSFDLARSPLENEFVVRDTIARRLAALIGEMDLLIQKAVVTLANRRENVDELVEGLAWSRRKLIEAQMVTAVKVIGLLRKILEGLMSLE